MILLAKISGSSPRKLACFVIKIHYLLDRCIPKTFYYILTTESLVQGALVKLHDDVAVSESAPGGMGAYRTALAASFLFKFLVHVALEVRALGGEGDDDTHAWVGAEESSCVDEYVRPVPQGVQFHAEGKPNAIVGQSTQHRAADLQVRIMTVI